MRTVTRTACSPQRDGALPYMRSVWSACNDDAH